MRFAKKLGSTRTGRRRDSVDQAKILLAAESASLILLMNQRVLFLILFETSLLIVTKRETIPECVRRTHTWIVKSCKKRTIRSCSTISIDWLRSLSSQTSQGSTNSCEARTHQAMKTASLSQRSSAVPRPRCHSQGRFSTSRGTTTPLAMLTTTRVGGCRDISATLTRKVAASHLTRAIGDSQENRRRKRTTMRLCRCWLNPRETQPWAGTTRTRKSSRLP